MSTTQWTKPVDSTAPVEPTLPRFSDAQWHELLHEDNVALSSISLLLAAIVGLGMLGMGIVVAILAFGS